MEKFYNSNPNSSTLKIDKIILNKFLWFPIFILVIMAMYFIAVNIVSALLVDNLDYFLNTVVMGSVNELLTSIGLDGFISNLIVNGILAGLFSVFLFLPNIIVIFFIIKFLEEIGYMSRVSFLFGKLFRSLGLDGKSSVSFILGSGCSIAGVIAAQTIEDDYERNMTIVLTPYVPCKGNLPVIVVFVSAFFSGNPFAAPLIYMMGILCVVISAFLGKIFIKNKHSKLNTSQIMLNNYQMANLKIVSKDVVVKIWSFIKNAGLNIVIASTIVWFLSSYNFYLQPVEMTESIIASLGKIIAPLFAPLGFGNWESAVAIVTGLAAKEVTVSTLGVLFAPNGDLTTGLQANFTAASALSFTLFSLLSVPCISAMSTLHQAVDSWKWTVGAIVYQMGLAYVISFIVYRIALLFI